MTCCNCEAVTALTWWVSGCLCLLTAHTYHAKLCSQEHATVEILKREQATLKALRTERKALLKRCAQASAWRSGASAPTIRAGFQRCLVTTGRWSSHHAQKPTQESAACAGR